VSERSGSSNKEGDYGNSKYLGYRDISKARALGSRSIDPGFNVLVMLSTHCEDELLTQFLIMLSTHCEDELLT